MGGEEGSPDLLAEIARGIQFTYANAQQLHEEAGILHKAGRFPRALFLHQISLEECGKIEMMGAWATSTFLGLKADTKKLSNAFRSHKAKNYANAYFAVVPDEEREARNRGDFKKASEAFSRLQKQIHEDMNNAKNAALYVDFDEKRFTTPTDAISEKMVVEIAAVNAYFLGLTGPKVRLLERMLSDDGSLKKALKTFMAQAEKLKDAGGDLDVKIHDLIAQMLKDYDPK